jgi:hypothetical protein
MPHKIPKSDLKSVQRIFDAIEDREERHELNLYITGYDEDEAGGQTDNATGAGGGEGMTSAEQGQPGQEPEESPTR